MATQELDVDCLHLWAILLEELIQSLPDSVVILLLEEYTSYSIHVWYGFLEVKDRMFES